MNARTYFAVQLQQNLEVHVQGALLRRVKEYLHCVQLPLEDNGWQESRQELFEMVVHGTVEAHVQDMSPALAHCLEQLRVTLQPHPEYMGPLPRRISKPLQDLLPLHLFLTRHQRPGAPTPPAPLPSEEEHPEDAGHAGLAAALDERQAFTPARGAAAPVSPTPAATEASAAPPHPPPQLHAFEASSAASPPPSPSPPRIVYVSSGQATPPNTRPFMPLSPLPRLESAALDQMIVVDMCSGLRKERGYAQVLQELLPGMPEPQRRNAIPLVKLLPELSADQVTQRRGAAQKDK